jgi:hypothetical protein
MSELRPGTTMGRIAELERATRELRSLLDDVLDRLGDLENSTPEVPQAQYEADLAVADLAESGYDEPYGEPEDDERGQS